MSGADITITPMFGVGGTFRVFVRPPGQRQIDVTFFRDVPTQFPQWSTTDPFGDAVAEIQFPAITMMDRPGAGDLWWLVAWADVDIVHYDENDSPSGWRWEGFIVSDQVGDDGLSIQCKGALFKADNYKAKPTYPQQPIPYEILIKQGLDPAAYPTGNAPLVIEWPTNWGTVVPATTGSASTDPMWFLRPWGVRPGQKWTGITTRSTGSWDPMLTGHIQTLLSVMYTEDGGQWTLRKRPGRIPVLQVRPALRLPLPDTLEVYAGAHGVSVSITRDFTQSANVIFGQGQDLAGTSFSGQQVSNDGATTYYEPFAALPYVYPSADTNPRYMDSFTRVESMLQFPQGIDEIAAREIAANQVRKFADPGYTGSITLNADPIQYDRPKSRFLIQAGQSIMVKGLRGTDILFHISEATVNMQEGTVSLTVDTKFRDALTVQEVRARTRDALDPVRLLQAGKYSTTVQDLIKPWSYANGSGVIPSGGSQDATKLFQQLMPANAQFPWTDWTTKYPPSKYPQYYIRVGPKNANATLNWSGVLRNGIAAAAIPIKLSQAGTIRLTQIAAYRADGTQAKVRFHVGIYGNSGVSASSMPMIPAAWANSAEGKATGYKASQRYPFFPDAFEQILANGEQQDQPNYLPAGQIDQMIAWGNYYEPAGYSPGLKSSGSPKTGQLIDETQWSFDTSNQPGFDKYSVENTAKNTTAGMGYILIYCDEQGTQPIYFLGRLFKTEASSA